MKKWLISIVVVIAIGTCMGIMLVPKSETAPLPVGARLITVTAQGYVRYPCEGEEHPSDEYTEVRLCKPPTWTVCASASTGPGGWYSVTTGGPAGTWKLKAFYDDGICTCESEWYTKDISGSTTWEQDIEFPYCRCGCHP